MIYLAKIKPRTVETVHTSSLEENNKIYINKGNIILLCGFYDTG